MKNLIAELLFKLAQKEEESKELCAQVEALEIIVTAMLRNMAQNDQQRLGNDSNLLIVFYVQIMPDDFVMQLHRF
ncbi:hypothetical protein pm083_18210 [Escherichia coli]|nr:hypothetical protein pm083_18210 [Escherichia coli]